MDQEFKLTMPNRLRRSPKGHYARKSPYTANTDDADITSFGLIAARCVIYQLAYFVRDQRLASRPPTGPKKPKVLALVNADEGCLGKNVFAGFMLDIAVGRFLTRSKMIDRKGK